MRGRGRGDGEQPGRQNLSSRSGGEPLDAAVDRRLDELLRGPAQPVAATAGAWATIRRRARRRRLAKAGGSVLAVLVVAAGAVPAIVAVRSHSDNQRLTLTNAPTPTQAPASRHPTPSPSAVAALPGADLHGFAPSSVSFVTQTEGYLLGPAHRSCATLARTVDGGQSWHRLAAPPFDDHADCARPQTVRFATSNDGFVFGRRLYATSDAGATWWRVATPGPIADLVAMNGRVWALVQHGSTVRLYSSPVVDPRLTRVTAVPPLRALPGTDTIQGSAALAVSGSAVDVITASQFASSPDGRRWSAGINPCPAKVHGHYVENVSLATWSPGDVVAVCGGELAAGAEFKRAYESVDGGHGWTTVHSPPPAGYLHTLGAGTADDLMLGTSRGGAQLSHNGGRTWASSRPLGIALGFVGFISPDHVVALPDTASSTTRRAFLSSDDAGRTWTVTRFPR